MTDIVRMQQATKRFGDREVLRATDLTVSAGEVVGIIGPNGGGKSTLLLLMAGLLRPTSGRVFTCGEPADKLALAAAGKVGLVMARPGLYPLLTGWENIDYFVGLFGLSRDEVRTRTAPLLARFELTDAMDARLATWSTGMQQKLSVVRALALSPSVLLFDEPAANLDPLAASQLYDELRARADGGMACVVVTHHLAAAESICDRVLLVDGGVRDEVRIAARRPGEDGPLLEAWKNMVKQ